MEWKEKLIYLQAFLLAISVPLFPFESFIWLGVLKMFKNINTIERHTPISIEY